MHTHSLLNMISRATQQNWKKLGVTSAERLQARANKKLSAKRIIPKEYFINPNNVSWVQQFLSKINPSESVESIIFSVALNLLTKKNIIHKEHVVSVLKEYNYPVISAILNEMIPSDEYDILGIIYQCLLTEGEKNIAGAYYTPACITHVMTQNCKFSNNQQLLDPCCGTGAFLLSIQGASPTQLYGIDCNPIAVMIAKINLLLKYDSHEFNPNILCSDFLEEGLFCEHTAYITKQYDYIITNPPWGASNYNDSNNKNSQDTFALFFTRSYSLLKQGGIIRFLLPEAVLNVKSHSSLRKFILNKTNLKQITYHSISFNGVLTRVVDIEASNTSIDDYVCIIKNKDKFTLPKNNFRKTENYVFNCLNSTDTDIIDLIQKHAMYDLKESIWALGIVTGDNKNKISNEKLFDNEPIYTGKDVSPFLLKDPTNYIKYDRDSMQQVAKEEYYRASEKLVYKFISNKLIFAYDNSQTLCLNSANILIPTIPNMSIKAVLAFLNSSLYQYLYYVLFSEIKILKGNLMELPFPSLTESQNLEITAIVDKILLGENNLINELNEFIYDLFEINNIQRRYIEQKIRGK